MSKHEIKKMKQGMSYSCKEKTIIMNVFKYFCNQLPEKCVTDIVRRTAKATGCSEKSIFQFRKEEASGQGFKQPSKTKIRKNININSRDIKYDQSVRQSIRNTIYDLRYRNIIPSLNTILKHLKSDQMMPKFSLMTLRRLLFDMGFTYEKDGKKFILVEKDDVNKCSKDDNKGLENHHVEESNRPIEQFVQEQHKVLNTDNIARHLPPMQPQPTNIVAPLPPQPPPLPPQSHMEPHLLDQQTRLLPMHAMHIGQPDQHLMHHPHNMPMMMNHSMPHMQPPTHHRFPPPTMDMHLKHDMHPWMHHHVPQQGIMKQ